MKSFKILSLLILIVLWSGGIGFGAKTLSGSTPGQQKDTADEEDEIIPVQVKLPFRIIQGIYQYKPITKDDLRLEINGQPRVIKELREFETAIGKRGELGRSFVLSFHINEYTPKIADAVSYFATEELIFSDMLFIVTPLSVYRFDVSRNKLKMVSEIEALVKKDCENFNSRRLNEESQLERQIMVLGWNIQNPYMWPGPGIAAILFLKHFPAEFKKFSDHYWLPDIGKYQRVIDFLKLREGERWCIHFQQREFFNLFFKTKRILQELKTYFSAESEMSNAVKNGILNFEKDLSLLDSYSAQPLLTPLQGANFNFSTIFLGGTEQGALEIGQTESFYVEKILRQTSLQSGGKALETTNPLEGMKDAIAHKDHYFEVVYNDNGDIEEKNIKIIIDNSQTKPSFKDKYTMAEYQDMVYYLTKEKIKIENISTHATEKAKVVSFALKSFEIRDPLPNDIIGKKFGVLRVRIQIHNQWGEKIYASERLLRVTEDIVTIAHTLPLQHEGKFILNIFAMDLIRNSSVSYTGNITL